jgi:hypothetical protein
VAPADRPPAVIARSPASPRAGLRREAPRAVTVIVAGLGLLLAAWVMATAPFTAPDEASHYLRALGIANGHLLGPKVPYVPAPVGLSPAQLAWGDQGGRAVWVTPAMSPPNVDCMNGTPDIRPPGCREASEVGNYQPLPYLLPAATLTVAGDSATGLWLSRWASAIPCLAFLVLAVAMLWDGTTRSLLGLVGAISPMVLFVCSILNPNGLEVAACLAFAATVLRIARSPTRAPAGVWAAFGCSGAVAILSWELGPIFVVGDLALGAVMLGPSGIRELSRRHRRGRRRAATALIAATVLYVLYGLASGVTHSTFDISPIRQSLNAGLDQLIPVLRQSVGTFGGETIPLSTAACWVWWSLVLALIAGALWVGRWRDRALLVLVVVLGLGFPIILYAWSYRFTGFGLEGRYVLPALMLVPLYAGEVIHRSIRPPPDGRWRAAAAAVVAVAGGFQAYAWWFDLPRHRERDNVVPVRPSRLEPAARLVTVDRALRARHRGDARLRHAHVHRPRGRRGRPRPDRPSSLRPPPPKLPGPIQPRPRRRGSQPTPPPGRSVSGALPTPSRRSRAGTRASPTAIPAVPRARTFPTCSVLRGSPNASDSAGVRQCTATQHAAFR